jgi:hypothetical protein
MPEPLDTSKVPDSINTRMSDEDKVIAARLMSALGICEGAQLMRYCLRAALREASVLPGSPLAAANRPADSRG